MTGKKGRRKVYEIPKWCNLKFHLDMNKDNYKCCKCNNPNAYWQEGDGYVFHSLCYNCYKKLKNKEKSK